MVNKVIFINFIASSTMLIFVVRRLYKYMTSEERHEIRYQRRKKLREEKRKKRSNNCGKFEEIFLYENLYKAGTKCIRGVLWKGSTQSYVKKRISTTYQFYEKIKEKKFKFSKPFVFYINERGKVRKIQAQKFSERVIQRDLCDNVIVPIYEGLFIYDNAANRVGKGMDHTLKRVNCHMQRHFRKYGLNGYIITCDFKDFFNSAPHDIVYKENEKRIYDKDIRDIANKCMEVYGDTGFGLGAHTSQIYTNIAVTPLDHYMKDKLRIKCYARYVDDFYFFTETLEEAHEILEKLRKKVKELGLVLNEKKTKIQKFAKGFKFLKTKFFCTETGKIIRKMNRDATPRMRRKIKTFKKWVESGKMTKEQVWNSYYSWRGHMKRGNSYKVLKSMDRYVYCMLES